MRESCTLVLNSDYLRTPDYPKQRRRFEELKEGLKRRGIEPKVKEIRFEGRDPLAVTRNIAGQIRDIMPDIYDHPLITFLGDSGVNPFSCAMQHNIDAHPVSEDKNLKPRRVIIAPGGSLNNISRHLGTAKKSVVIGITSGEMPCRTQEIKIRSATVSTFDGPGDGNGSGQRGNRLTGMTFPWLGFAGAGFDGCSLNHWENQPRSSPLAVRGIKTALQSFKHLLGMDREGGGVSVYSKSFIAIPNMSLFYFGQEYDSLDKPYVYHLSLEHEGMADVMKSFLVCVGVGTVPAINSALWARGNGHGSNGNGRASANGNGSDNGQKTTFSGIVDELKPRKVENHKIMIPPSESSIQLDGFPLSLEEMGLREGGHAEMEISTTPRSIFVARKSPEGDPGLS